MSDLVQCALAIASVVLAASCTSGRCGAQPDALVVSAVERFCRAEFSGVEERYKFVRFSAARQADEEAADPAHGGTAISWTGGPLHVVATFHIEDTKVYENSAIAQVRYRLLASTEGTGDYERRIVPAHGEEIESQLQLRFDGKRWWIVDPPVPKVSGKVLLGMYENAVSQSAMRLKEASGDPHLSEQGRKNMRKLHKEQLAALNVLRTVVQGE